MTESLDNSPHRWPDVSRVFSAAVGLEESARKAYLDEACRNDSALRVTVDSMLRAHNEAGSFGETPAFAPSGTVKRLAPDTQLGPFRIERLLGAGGMGEVYRAHDTKLQRAVAIKVLPDSFANDADRRSRFEEEARALAALNHPHIGAIYGVEESGDVVALVLELVDGLTLDERLAAGPIAFDEVLRIARQLGDGLEAAHDRGIVHRDFKPGNIKITPDGNVKILDFGLAKIDGSQVGAATVGSPTGSRHATQVGMVVGTAGYMSPEQARGLAVDKRTDIWAFGCVLFRMCAQQPPFTGTTVTGALEAVIAREPDWDLLPASTPPYFVRILRRCLTKDPKLRLRDIGEARIALELAEDADTGGVQTRAPRRLISIAAVGGALALTTALGIALYGPARSTSSPPPASIRFVVPPPEGALFDFHPAQTFLALSPDGSQLAFLASMDAAPRDNIGSNRIWLRALTDLEARPLQGTDGVTAVFWSPNGRSLAFFADGKLKRFDLPSGPAVTLCELPEAWHGTWGAEDVILFAHSDGKAISAVSASGCVTPRTVVTANRSTGDVRVHWPWFLPDGKRFLFTARRDDGEGELRIGELDGATHPLLMRVSSNAQWINPDVVVFAREGLLMAQRVDLERAASVGEPFSIADQVEYFFTTSRAMFSASRTGTIAYHPGGNLEQLVWADRNGRVTGTIGKPADYDLGSSRLSRDGQKLLTSRKQRGLGGYDIWRHDLVRGNEEQLTRGRGSEVAPVWIDDERAILFAGDSPGSLPHLFRRDLVAGSEKQLLPSGAQQLVMDVLPGGRAVAYAERQAAGGFKVFQLPLTDGASPAPLLPPQFRTNGMRVSPDGRALAFRAGRQGGALYVAPFPVTSEPSLAATGIWSAPRWSADSRQLYYVGSDRRMMTVPVRTGPPISIGIAQQLFTLKPSASLLEVSRDGRFLLLVPHVRAAERPIIVGTAMINSAGQ